MNHHRPSQTLNTFPHETDVVWLRIDTSLKPGADALSLRSYPTDELYSGPKHQKLLYPDSAKDEQRDTMLLFDSSNLDRSEEKCAEEWLERESENLDVTYWFPLTPFGLYVIPDDRCVCKDEINIDYGQFLDTFTEEASLRMSHRVRLHHQRRPKWNSGWPLIQKAYRHTRYSQIECKPCCHSESSLFASTITADEFAAILAEIENQ